MSSERLGSLCAVNKNVNSKKYVSTLEDFLILNLEVQIGDNGVIIMDDNAS